MSPSKIDAFRAMVAKNPENPLAHFGLANEAMKEGFNEEALEHFQAYLARHEDEGNAWGRLAELFVAMGRTDDARDAFTRGIDAAKRHGHPGMVNEFEARMDELD